MRWLSSLATFALWSSMAVAQSLLKDLPNCAKDCVGSNFGGCSLLDVPCICANKDLIQNLSCCVANTCSAADQAAVIKFSVNLCVANGVSVPTSATCAASQTGSSAPSSGSSSATITPTPTAAANSATTGAAQTGAAAVPTMGSGLGLGVAMAGLLAVL